MIIRSIILLLCSVVLTGCTSSGQGHGFIINGRFFHSDFLDSGDHSGKWRRDGHSIQCDGYMTRHEDYCEEIVPEAWKPFVFNGETYYMQPLQRAEEQL